MTTLSGPVPLSDDHPDELLTRSITPPLQTGGELEQVYEIERTRRLLREGKFERAALQFPDDMLVDAASVARKLQEDAQYKVYILADTSYGRYCPRKDAIDFAVVVSMKLLQNIFRQMLSCTMDELVFHRTISQNRTFDDRTSRLPVIYVFGRRKVDIDSLASQFTNAVPEKDSNILLICDTSYAHSLGTLHPY
jgi:diphthamide biosynthesis protein 2